MLIIFVQNAKSHQQLIKGTTGSNVMPLALFFYIAAQMAQKGDDIMRKYTLADGSKRGVVDLRDFSDVITAAVEEFAPGTTVTVFKDYYLVDEQLTQSQAVKIGRKICESDLKYHCVKLSKLFNSKLVKENTNDSRKEQKQDGKHYRVNASLPSYIQEEGS